MNRGYLDVLRPDDWLFVFIDPGDGGTQDPLFMGFLDDIRESYTIDQSGASRHSIVVTASGWEKAVHQTSVITDQWVSKNINFPTLFNLASRCQTDEPYYPKTSNVIQAALQSFLDAEGTEAWMEMRAQQNSTSREQAESLGVQVQQAMAQDVQEEPSTRPSARTGDDEIRALMGQFELPGTRVPLWQLLKLKFEDLRERTAITPMGMVGLLNRPLSGFLDEWTNGVLNTIIYDVRRISSDGLSHLSTARSNLDTDATGGYTIWALRDVLMEAAEVKSDTLLRLFNDTAPYVIFMRRPLFPDELLRLDGPTISQGEVTAMNLGFSDADHYNLSWLEPMLIPTSIWRQSTGLTGVDQDRHRSIEAIRRHGLRIYTDQTNCYPDRAPEGFPPDFPVHHPEYFREWNFRIQRAGLDQPDLLVGSITVPKYVRGLYFGGKLVLNIDPHPGVFAAGQQRVFYVDGFDWRYLARTGEFDTTVALTRGYMVSSGGVQGQSHQERYGR